MYSVIHGPVNLTQFTDPGNIQDFATWQKCGKVRDKNIGELKLNIEYDLDIWADFDIVDRDKQVKHEHGLVYDDLYFRLKEGIIPDPVDPATIAGFPVV